MEYIQFVKELVNNLGGEENIRDAYFCMTRLRLTVANKTKVNTDAIKKLSMVKQVQYKGSELQVVIGTEVGQVYDELMRQIDPKKLGQTRKIEVPDDEKENILTKIVGVLGGIFVPIILALTAGGMIKSVSTLLITLGWMDGASDLAALLSIVGDSVFYFLPFFIAVTTARVIKTNEYLALMIAGSLMYPTMINGLESGANALVVFGINLPIIAYNGSVFPIILGVVLLKVVYGFLDKTVHRNIRMIFAPLLAMLITVPLTFAFLAPLGNYLGIYLAQGITWIFNTNGVIAAFVTGFFLPLIVMAGMHQALFPIMLTNLAEVGFDNLLPLFYLQTLALAGATFAVFVASKKVDTKATALSTGISAAFGVTEPALYGIGIPLKKPLIAALVASGVAGGLSNLLGVRAFAFGLPSFLSIPTYVNEAQGSSLTSVIVSSLVALILSFILSYILMIRDQKNQNEKAAFKTDGGSTSETVYSPVNDGVVVDLSLVQDNVFSNEIMGPTVAINPKNKEVYAPVAGKVVMISETKHAIGIKTNSGVEVLIHIGIDTVKLNGEPFNSSLKVGDTVQQGDLITEVNLEYLSQHNIDNTIILAITNTKQATKLVEGNTEINIQTALLTTNI